MNPHGLEDYVEKYESISFERSSDGILTMRIHFVGDPSRALEYGAEPPYGWHHPHVEWSHAFNDVARDPENEIVILTGTGEKFIGEESTGSNSDEMLYAPDAFNVGRVPAGTAADWDQILHNGTQLQMNLLSIDVPVIAAVNGPALTHAELVVQSDVVLCTDDTVFQDQPHFESGLFAPGDSVALVWPSILGQNRGRYFLLTGEKIDAKRAMELGIVSEVLSRDALIPRAEELARRMLKRPRLIRRYARQIMVHEMKQRMLNHVAYGLALEGLSVAAREMS